MCCDDLFYVGSIELLEDSRRQVLCIIMTFWVRDVFKVVVNETNSYPLLSGPRMGTNKLCDANSNTMGAVETFPFGDQVLALCKAN